MKRSIRLFVLSGAVILPLCLGVVSSAIAAGPRAVAVIMQDFQKAESDLSQVMGSNKDLTDAAKRDRMAPAALPLLRKELALLNELLAADSSVGAQLSEERLMVCAYLAVLNDKATNDELTAKAKGRDELALMCMLDLDLASWWRAGDAAAQNKVLDQVTTLAKARPDSDFVGETVAAIMGSNPLSDDIAARAENLVLKTLTCKATAGLKSSILAQQKLAANVGKPIVLAGKTPDGKAFTTASWKGKVILVDFWATWCGPCKAELPRVKAVYADLHAKGLEVLGVSNDYSADDLKKFVAADHEIAWPSLFNAAAAANHQWNPITTGYGINGIPTMFLIDKKGILRSVKAREDFEKEIPKLLDEK